MRVHRPSNSVPVWARWAGGVAAAFVLLVFSLGTMPVYRTGAKTCQRCGAVERGPAVLGLWLGREVPPSPGRALVERVAGPCATHRFESTGCWYGFSGVACTIRPTGEPAYEICALAGGATAERLAARLAQHSAGERESIVFASLTVDELGVETPEAARRWIADVLEKQGWADLDAGVTPARR